VAKQPTPQASAESSPSPKADGASGDKGRKSAATPKAKSAKHAAKESTQKKPLAKAAKGGIARRLVRELRTSRRGSPVRRRVRKAIRQILEQSRAEGGSSSKPSTAARAVQEILNQVGAK